MTVFVAVPIEQRFWSKVAIGSPDECWLWLASVRGDGYGKTGSERRTLGAHRVAYELVKGPIPSGLVIDHLCNRPLCVNPAHLEAVTQRENLRRQGARQTHCKRGHDYSLPGVVGWSTNVLKDGSTSPGRRCLVCQRQRRKANATSDPDWKGGQA